MNEVYQELLDTPEWRSVRDKIIQRDNNRCTCCYNSKFIPTLTVVETSIYRQTRNGEYLHYTRFNGVTCCLKSKGSGTELYFVHKDSVPHKPPGFYDHFLNYVARISLADYKEFLVAKKDNDWSLFNKWEEVKGLHDHHSYYKIGLKPWEYPLESLTTLCADCHKEFHKNNLVKILNQDGTLRTQLKLIPCDKCKGTGYLPEYHYYLGGVCFDCNGIRYDLTQTIQSYFSEIDDGLPF